LSELIKMRSWLSRLPRAGTMRAALAHDIKLVLIKQDTRWECLDGGR
jgi:hypothetical protein